VRRDDSPRRLTYAAGRPTYATTPVPRPACRVPPSAGYVPYGGVSWPDGTVVSACGPIPPARGGLPAAIDRVRPTGSPTLVPPTSGSPTLLPPTSGGPTLVPSTSGSPPVLGGLARRPARSAVTRGRLPNDLTPDRGPASSPSPTTRCQGNHRRTHHTRARSVTQSSYGDDHGTLDAGGELTPKRGPFLYERRPAQDLLNNSGCVLLAYPSEE